MLLVQWGSSTVEVPINLMVHSRFVRDPRAFARDPRAFARDPRVFARVYTMGLARTTVLDLVVVAEERQM